VGDELPTASLIPPLVAGKLAIAGSGVVVVVVVVVVMCHVPVCLDVT
jgi:hypothetical protein